MLYARKRIKSGPMLEDLYYPILPSGRLVPGSIPKTSGTSEAQERYNAKKAEMQLVRYANANFDSGSIWLTLTYSDDNPRRPKNYKEAKDRLSAYLRRVKRYRESAGLPELKYIYVIEEKTRRSGPFKGERACHYHLLMSEMDRNVAEKLWTDGERVNADRFDPWRFGQESAARYMAKAGKVKAKKADQPETGEEAEEKIPGRKRFVCSRNCKKPEIPKRQRRMELSKRRAESMAKDHEKDAGFWQSKAPEGYAFKGMDYILNERNGHYYWRVTYRRLPEWDTKKKRKKNRAAVI